MGSRRRTQERLLAAFMGAALAGLAAAILWPSGAVRNVRVLTASLEMYPLPAWPRQL